MIYKNTMKIQQTFRAYALAAALSLVPVAAAAQSIINPLNYNTLDQAIDAILGVLINLGAIALVVFFVYAGFNFVAAQGNPEKLEKARRALGWSIVGAAILLGAKALSVLIQNTLRPIMNS